MVRFHFKKEPCFPYNYNQLLIYLGLIRYNHNFNLPYFKTTMGLNSNYITDLYNKDLIPVIQHIYKINS